MIVIIDYGLGNLQSVANVLDQLKIEHKVSGDKQVVSRADKLILPGVGAFGTGMKNLQDLGLIEVLNESVLEKKKPFLGICLGMQLICAKSYEGGEYSGLGWIEAEVVKFSFEDRELRVPHIGWNDVTCNTSSVLFQGGNEKQFFYFVHSYFVKPKDQSIVIGTCNYGEDFCAALSKDNIFATQFHPEKSQYEGIEMIKKFVEIL